MSDTKTSGLSALAATPATGDLFMVVDVSDTTMAATGTNKYLAASYVVSLDRAETLTNKTLTTPVIGDFTNAGHSHTNSAGGGQLDHGTALTGLGDDDHPQYELESNNTAAAILTKLLTVDGAGSGLDADLLDGNSSAAFLLATGATTGATSQAQTFTNGINGGIAANDDITIEGTSHATKTSSYVLLQPSGGFVGIGTAAPEVPLHLVGTNGEIRLQNVATDATNKFGRFTVANYTNGSLPFLGFNITSLSTSTLASFGGSSSVAYAVTRLSFYAAANNSTTTGTEVVRVNVNGMSVGTAADPTAVLHVAASTTARASVCVPHGAAPTSPVNGDFWTTTANAFIRINGTTRTIASGVTGSAFTQTYSTAARTVNAYTTDAESAYTGQDNAQVGSVYAKYADLEALRVAYTNLEASHLNLLQVVTALIDDAQAFAISG